MKQVKFILVIMLTAFTLAGCQTVEIDTFEKWCENISGVDMEEKYASFWAVFVGISVKDEAIRDDFVKTMNDGWMKKAKGRIDKMVWREGKVLHIVNPSSLWEIDSKQTTDFYRAGILAFQKGKDKDRGSRCLFGAIVLFFDKLVIHNLEGAIPGHEKDIKIVIDTGRKEILKGEPR